MADVETFTAEDMERIARVVHEANRAYIYGLFKQGEAPHSDLLPPWDGAPDYQQAGMRVGVRDFIEGRIQNVGDAHRRWMDLKLAEGWTYGPVKDARKKEHPCLLPFEQLSEYHQRKDFIFCAVMMALTMRLEDVPAR